MVPRYLYHGTVGTSKYRGTGTTVPDKNLRRSKRIKKKGSRKLRKLSGGKKKTYWQHSKKVLKPGLQYGLGAAVPGVVPGVGAVYAIRRSKKTRRNRLNRRSKRHSLKRQNQALYAEYSKYA